MNNETAPRTIVVATDFSEDAAAALIWAKQLARRHHARIVLVHSLVAEALPAPEFVPLLPQHYEEIHRDARHWLEGRGGRPAQRRRHRRLRGGAELPGRRHPRRRPAARCGADRRRHPGPHRLEARAPGQHRGAPGARGALSGVDGRTARTACIRARSGRCWCRPISRRTQRSPPTPRRASSATSAPTDAWSCCTSYRVPVEAMHLPAPRCSMDAIRAGSEPRTPASRPGRAAAPPGPHRRDDRPRGLSARR